MTDTRFYVYEHWRPDLDVCFWVGKGTGDRAYRFKRNAGYDAVASHLASIGMCVEVRMVESGMTNIEALSKEEQRIKFWRAIGVVLTNRNDGGRGAGKIIAASTREKLRLANLGKKASEETRAKMRASQKARKNKAIGRPKGFRHAPETIKKIAQSTQGSAVSDERREHLRQFNLGKRHSAETKRKMSIARIGNKYGCGGKGLKRSEETRAKMSASQKGKILSAETRKKIAEAARRQQQERGKNGRFRSAVSSS